MSCQRKNIIVRPGSYFCLLLAFCLSFFCPNTYAAQTPSQKSLESVERQLLRKTFLSDPMDKRLQRLELLVFGATQYGAASQRWQRLLQTLSEKPGLRQSGRAEVQSTTQRRAINQLEKQILKKNYVRDSAQARLNRLELKIFGQSSPTMTSQRRVERLNRAIGGCDQTDGNQTAIKPFDLRQDPGQLVLPFRNPESLLNPGYLDGMPQLGQGLQANRQMAELLNEMQRQMQALQRFSNVPGKPGSPGLLPRGMRQFRYYDQWLDGQGRSFQSPCEKIKPLPDKPSKVPFPGLRSPNTNEIPPYGDPNSI